jgi:hypothetical protein
MFGIDFLDCLDGGRTAKATIKIGDYSETLLVDLGTWTAKQYQGSWLRSASNAIDRGFGRFVTSMEMNSSGILWTWPCWRKQEGVLVFRNQILRVSSLPISSPEAAETYDDGLATEDEVSEWTTTVNDVVAFARKLSGAPS